MSRHWSEATPNKTAVETILVGRERAYDRRFLQMCSHYLIEPVACTPASGSEKGQVELVRDRFFTPRVRAKSYDELNACSSRRLSSMPLAPGSTNSTATGQARAAQ